MFFLVVPAHKEMNKFRDRFALWGGQVNHVQLNKRSFP
jgi:hypothetical protein